MLKEIRNLVADAAATLVLRFPVLMPGFRGVGFSVGSLPVARLFYYRAIRTLEEQWRKAGSQVRLIEIDNHRFLFDATDLTTSSWFFRGRLFEPETTRFIIKNVSSDDTVIDIGANRGYITVLAALRVGPNGTVYSFEPNPAVRRDLESHVNMNSLDDRVLISDRAVSNVADERLVFYLSNVPANTGLSSLTPQEDLLATNQLSTDNTMEVTSTTLDAWLGARGQHQPVKLIKVDVEGAEMQVLRGANKLLRDHPPKWWIIETKEGGPVAPFMRDYGYECRAIDPASDKVNLLCTHDPDNR